MVDQARESTYLEHYPRDVRLDLERDAAQDALVIDLRDGAIVDIGDTTTPTRGRVYARADEGLLGAPNWGLGIKRAIDIVTSVFFLVAFSPVLLIAAIAVKLTSPGPLFYVQERVGKGGETFRFAKFRSMRNGAHTELDDLQHLNEVDGPVFKIKDDPRITPVGRFMRKYSIDELPQLVHVLTGQMSLVGPRPPLPTEVATYDGWHRQRLLVKPGITCIWQVSGRSDLDFETWVALDIEYIRTWRPWLDFVILLKTLPAVISAKGAY
jgi:lipopolysaccharide/colanic/teichoic acid biosynthesis glycosyltransferase